MTFGPGTPSIRHSAESGESSRHTVTIALMQPAARASAGREPRLQICTAAIDLIH